MANWLNKINIADLMEGDDDESAVRVGSLVAGRMKQLKPYLKFGPHAPLSMKNDIREQFESIIEELEGVFVLEDFNLALEHLYDLGDMSLDDTVLGGRKFLWIETTEYQIPGSRDCRVPREYLIKFLTQHGMSLRELDGITESQSRSELKDRIWKNLDGLDGYSKFIEYVLNFVTEKQLLEIADVYDPQEETDESEEPAGARTTDGEEG